MGLFQSKKAAERFEDRLYAVELKQDELQRTCRGLALEYEELWDKVRHQMSRMSKRVAVAKKEAENGLDAEPETGPEPDTDQISQSILRRRGMRPKLP